MLYYSNITVKKSLNYKIKFYLSFRDRPCEDKLRTGNLGFCIAATTRSALL